MTMAPATRAGDRRGRSVFIRSSFGAALGVLLSALAARPAGATIRAAITSQNPRSTFYIADAAGGSLSMEPRQFVPTTELGLDLPVGGNFQAGVFVNRIQFDTGYDTFRMLVLGGSLIRPLVLGTQFGWRVGLGLADGAGVNRSTVGVTEFVVTLPVPGIRGAGIQVVHQILVNYQGPSPAYDVFHVNRVGMCIQML